MPPAVHVKMTQRKIAELAGVSQTTVSLVLNGEDPRGTVRIPKKTREHVLSVAGRTAYVADPAARRLAGVGNRIMGVFTYEPAFPQSNQDFYAPLLTGIEAQAEMEGFDLLIFSSAPVTNGRRQLFDGNNRIQLSDGCLLLGLEMDGIELQRLVDTGFPFVAVGRREKAGVPYVGIDYASATSELVQRALDLGHRRFLLLYKPSSGEALVDRKEGFRRPLRGRDDVEHWMRPLHGGDFERAMREILDLAPSLLVIETQSDAEEIVRRLVTLGINIPADVSILALGSPGVTTPNSLDFTSLEPPRIQVGEASVQLLGRLLSDEEQPTGDALRTLLPCAIHDGTTLAEVAT